MDNVNTHEQYLTPAYTQNGEENSALYLVLQDVYMPFARYGVIRMITYPDKPPVKDEGFLMLVADLEMAHQRLTVDMGLTQLATSIKGPHIIETWTRI